MARIVPLVVRPGTASRGEQKLFRLQGDPDPQGWTGLRSPLSPRKRDACAANVIQAPREDRLTPFRLDLSGDIANCTVHASGCLEAPAVIVTNIEHVEGEASHFYVATTRALHRLVILRAKSCTPSPLEPSSPPSSGAR